MSSSGRPARSQLADECGVLVPREASHCLATDEFTINFGSPFGSLISLVPLTFKTWSADLKPATTPTMAVQ